MADDNDLAGPRSPWWRAAVEEAGNRGSSTVEPEHVLLGIASHNKGAAAVVLNKHGLDYRAIDEGLKAERQLSLAAAGIPGITFPDASPKPMRGRPNPGAAMKDVFMRLRRDHARKGRPTELDLLRSLFAAELGTVPRLLTVTGVDRDALMADLTAD